MCVMKRFIGQSVCGMIPEILNIDDGYVPNIKKKKTYILQVWREEITSKMFGKEFFNYDSIISFLKKYNVKLLPYLHI